MPSIFGSPIEKGALRRLVGGMAQVAGIRLVELADGRVRGLRAADVYTGSGFRFQVLLDRGLDYLDGKDADLRAILHFEKQLAASLGVTEPGIEPHRSIGSHFGGVPPQRSELMDRIG